MTSVTATARVAGAREVDDERGRGKGGRLARFLLGRSWMN